MESPEINIIATTISGSVKDWRKLKMMEKIFKKFYSGRISLYIVNSHQEAFEKAKELTKKGKRIIISAGGAGTFNSILEGVHINNRIPQGLVLGFLRKGSADLLGKALNIPDDLEEAARVICNSVMKKKFIPSSIIEIDLRSINGKRLRKHFIGFGGVGVFGDVPYFTENKLVKYYKGILGLFGDRVPFLVGINLSLLRHFLYKIWGVKKEFDLIIDNREINLGSLLSLILINGDLGEDFPLAKELSLGEKRFKAILFKDTGLVDAYKKLIQCWQGKLFNKSVKDIEVFYVNNHLIITPRRESMYMINLDGLGVITRDRTTFCLGEVVNLISG